MPADTYQTSISKENKIRLVVNKFDSNSAPLELLKRYILAINPTLANLSQEDLEDFLQSYMLGCVKSFKDRSDNGQSQSNFLAYCLFRAKTPIPQVGNYPLIKLRGNSYYNNNVKKHKETLKLDRPTPDSENGFSLLDSLESKPEQEAREYRDYINELLSYIDSKLGEIGVKYLLLFLADRTTVEIDEILGLSTKDRDYLQQRVKYHCECFETGWDTWQIHHDYFGIGIDVDLGLSGGKLDRFLSQLSESDLELYETMKTGEISKIKHRYENGKLVLRLSTKNQWRKILKLAKKIRIDKK